MRNHLQFPQKKKKNIPNNAACLMTGNFLPKNLDASHNPNMWFCIRMRSLGEDYLTGPITNSWWDSDTPNFLKKKRRKNSRLEKMLGSFLRGQPYEVSNLPPSLSFCSHPTHTTLSHGSGLGGFGGRCFWLNG